MKKIVTQLIQYSKTKETPALIKFEVRTSHKISSSQVMLIIVNSVIPILVTLNSKNLKLYSKNTFLRLTLARIFILTLSH